MSIVLQGTPKGTWPPAAGGVAVRAKDAAGAEHWTTAPQLTGPNIAGAAIANRIAAPQCRGVWHMSSSYDGNSATNVVLDETQNARHLTINGNPTFSVYQASGLPEVPYIDFDGTGDYLTRADETGISITGAVTMVLWWKPDDATPAASRNIAGNITTTGNQRSFSLANITTGVARAQVSVDGTALVTVDSVAAMADATWHQLVIRYIPSTELSVFLNGVEALNTTSIPASLHNSTGAFSLGGTGDGSAVCAGHMALASLHAVALTDETIAAFYAQERALFGV